MIRGTDSDRAGNKHYFLDGLAQPHTPLEPLLRPLSYYRSLLCTYLSTYVTTLNASISLARVLRVLLRAALARVRMARIIDLATFNPPMLTLLHSPRRRLRHRHRRGRVPHVRDRFRGRGHVLGLQQQRPAGHREHHGSEQPGGCGRCRDGGGGGGEVEVMGKF